MQNNDLIQGLVNDFFSQANLQKRAADQTNPQGAGSEELKAKKTGHEVSEISADNTLSAETDRGKEMEADLKDSEMGALNGNAQLAADSGAQVSEDDEVEHPQDNPQSPKTLNADESVKMTGDNVNVTDVTTAHAAPSELAKVARLERLGHTLLSIVADDAFGLQKQASAHRQAPVAEYDVDALESFLAYNAGFERGLQKKAEDINEVVESGLAPSEEEAAALLDTAAVQDPEAVLPEEAMPEAQMSGDDMAALDELAGELEAAGIEPEELIEAQAQVEQIKAETGATDEEIVQMITEELAAEEGLGDEGLEEEAPMEKVASERISLRDVLAYMYGTE